MVIEGEGLIDDLTIDPQLSDNSRKKVELTNLLSNAIKYTEQGNITVRVDLYEADRQVGRSRRCCLSNRATA